MLSEQGTLNDMVNQLTQSKKKIIQPTVTTTSSHKSKKRPLNEKKKNNSNPKAKKKNKWFCRYIYMRNGLTELSYFGIVYVKYM